MSNINLNDITSGYNISKINNNFDSVQESINTDLLNRSGGNNTMHQDLDMDSHKVINVTTDLGNPSSLATVEAINDLRDALEKEMAGVTGGMGAFNQIGAGAFTRTFQDKMRDQASILDFDTAENLSNDIASAINKAYTNSLKSLFIPKGTWKLKSPVEIGDMILYGEGANSIIDATGPEFSGKTSVISSTGSVSLVPTNLASNATEGDLSISVLDGTQFEPNEVYCIFNPTESSWLTSRTYYNAGEWFEVESVVGNTVNLKNCLYDSYNVADVVFYKMNSVTCQIKDLTIKGSQSVNVLSITNNRDSIFSGLNITHDTSSSIAVEQCYNLLFDSSYLSNTGLYDSFGTQYAISIGNSFSVKIVNSNLYSERHAVATGGNAVVPNVPNRDIRTRGCTLRKNMSLTPDIAVANFHGNTEDSSFENCTLYGAVNLAGRNVSVRGCSITAQKLGYGVYCSEIKGGTFGLYDCDIRVYANPATNSRGIFDFGGNSVGSVDTNMTLDLNIICDNIRVYGRNFGTNTSFVTMVNRGSTSNVNISLTNIYFDCNAFGQVCRLLTVNSSPDNSRYIVVDNINGLPDGAALVSCVSLAYVNTPMRLMKQAGIISDISTVANSYTPSTITLKHPYPRAPYGHITVCGPNGGNQQFIGGKNIVTKWFRISTTTITPMFYTVDGNNMSAGASFEIHWEVGMNEV